MGACSEHSTEHGQAHGSAGHTIIATSPQAKDVISTKRYVCQIHSRRHIEVRALERGYLEEIHVQEGQRVFHDDVMFKLTPVVYQAHLDHALAEAERARIELDNAKLLLDKNVVSPQDVALAKAELARAQADVDLKEAELSFMTIQAPFDGIVDRQMQQVGSLVEEEDILTTLSDNSVMWVYFNMSEARYLEYQAMLNDPEEDLSVGLELANGNVFSEHGEIGAIEADFDNRTGNIAFRADFANEEGLLRHGQTGTILLRKTLKGALVIPQRATYEILAKRYVYVIEPALAGEPGLTPETIPPSEHAAVGGTSSHQTEPRRFGIVRQREIVIQEEMEDIYIIESGLTTGETIIFEGVSQVRDGDNVTYHFTPADSILQGLKHHAE